MLYSLKKLSNTKVCISILSNCKDSYFFINKQTYKSFVLFHIKTTILFAIHHMQNKHFQVVVSKPHHVIPFDDSYV